MITIPPSVRSLGPSVTLFRRTQLIVIALFCAIPVAAWAGQLGIEDATRASAPQGGECTFSFANENANFQKASSAAEQQSAEAKSRGPLTEKDIEEVSRAMKMVELDKQHGRRLGAVGEKGELSAERLNALLGDVGILLADIDARQILDRANHDAALKKELGPAMLESLGAIRGCATAQFAERGGKAAYEESLKVVQKHQEDLKELVDRAVSQPEAARPLKKRRPLVPVKEKKP